MNVNFRVVTQTDWDAIAPMMLGLYQADPSPNLVTQDNVARTLQETIQHPEKLQLIGFSLDHALIGYALLVFYWSNEMGGNVIFIDELFIQAAHRGQGLATQFFTWLEQQFEQQAQAFVLETTPTNTRARALYQKLGFHPYKNQLLIKRQVQVIDNSRAPQ
ncbi:MAG: GNAT family N-acetyltransferase [Leptolyngbyaceae cyanobacterium bins.349]|nr:GNAT family N-acetyltransferase [Leptolyngbyaceae cyanobacterium bins.349]